MGVTIEVYRSRIGSHHNFMEAKKLNNFLLTTMARNVGHH